MAFAPSSPELTRRRDGRTCGFRQSRTFSDGSCGGVIAGGGAIDQKLATHALVVALGVVGGRIFGNKMALVGLAKMMEWSRPLLD